MIEVQRSNGQAISEPALNDALTVLGFRATETNREQLAVMLRSLDIFQGHTEGIGELWRDVGTDDTAHHIRHKAQRLYHAEQYKDRTGVMDPDFPIDSALDLINYAAFYVRQKEAS